MEFKAIKIIICILSTILTIELIALCNLNFRINYKVKPYTPSFIPNISLEEKSLNKESAKKLVKDLFSTFHFYNEKNLDDKNRDGQSLPIWRVVTIHNDLSLHDYIISYTHELTHVKYQVLDETYTTYKSIIILYESGNKELQYHAIKEANNILNGCYKDTEYDCGYYLINYFKNTC